MIFILRAIMKLSKVNCAYLVEFEKYFWLNIKKFSKMKGIITIKVVLKNP
jgi:hypothetical protein